MRKRHSTDKVPFGSPTRVRPQSSGGGTDRRTDGAGKGLPQTTYGPYVILEKLGRGGMGAVYRAQHIETGQSAALKTVKVPQPKQLASIRREVQALARIRHPGIVRIIAEGVEREEHLQLLRKMHCDMVQGYFISHPLPASEFEKMIVESLKQRA